MITIRADAWSPIIAIVIAIVIAVVIAIVIAPPPTEFCRPRGRKQETKRRSVLQQPQGNERPADTQPPIRSWKARGRDDYGGGKMFDLLVVLILTTCLRMRG